jgi:formate hydrogenlyase subunit 4
MVTGSSFEGMGASREATFSTIVETAFFILIGSLALLTDQTSFHDIFMMLNPSVAYTAVVKLLLVVSLFIMLLAEGCRVPVDDPATHLELTMIHEVMILDYSGPDLAYIMYAAALKMVVIATLAADLLLPTAMPSAPALALFAVILFLLFLFIGIVESSIARLRISHVPQFLFLMTALSLTAFAVSAFFLRGGY